MASPEALRSLLIATQQELDDACERGDHVAAYQAHARRDELLDQLPRQRATAE